MAQKTKIAKPTDKKKVITKVTTTKLIVTDEKGKVEKVIHAPTKIKKKTVVAKKPTTKKPVVKKPVTKKSNSKPIAKKTTKPVAKKIVNVTPKPEVTKEAKVTLAEALPAEVQIKTETTKKRNYTGIIVSAIIVAFIIVMFFVML